MITSIECFKDLIESYPTWPLLKNYIESDKGGAFQISEANEKGLCMIHYDKDTSVMNVPYYAWFRSVVWNTILHCPVSVAPPKTCTDAFPCSTMQEVVDKQLVCEEFLEGFMINCFHLVGEPTLFITSRSKLDATGHFYSAKSFRQLFVEAYLNRPIDSVAELEDAISTIYLGAPNKDQQEVAVCYSFLVQHTEHRIVSPIQQSNAQLIHTATFYEDGHFCLEQHGEPLSLSLPNDATRVTDWVHRLFQTNSWDFQGVVWKDEKGNRWRNRSEKYMAVRSLRGNYSQSIDRFVQLHSQQIVPTYLQYYPEDSIDFSFYGFLMSYIISIVYEYYIGVRVTKTMALADIDKMYHTHLYHLHGEYVSSLRPTGKKITREVVQRYFHKQAWQRLVFLLKKHKEIYFAQLAVTMNQSITSLVTSLESSLE